MKTIVSKVKVTIVKSLPFYFRYIQHTLSDNQILMKLNPGEHHMPENPSHVTLTIESQNPDTKAKEIKRLYLYLSASLAFISESLPRNRISGVVLTLSKTTHFRLFQTEKKCVQTEKKCGRHFQI